MPSIGRKTASERDPKTGRFLPGNKGGGRKRMDDDLKAAFREACPEALRVLKEIMLREDAQDRDRIRAAEIILDRGYGKPVQAVDLAAQADQQGQVGVILMPEVKLSE